MPPNITDNVDNRMQFLVQSNLADEELKGNEELDLKINLNQGYPNETNKYKYLTASGILEQGIIKTIPHKSKHYCLKSDCKYYVTIEQQNIDLISFLATVFKNKSVIRFNHDLNLIEELEKNEEVVY